MAATTGNTQGRVGGGTHMKPQNQTEHNIQTTRVSDFGSADLAFAINGLEANPTAHKIVAAVIPNRL